jgi:hypothetical protein
METIIKHNTLGVTKLQLQNCETGAKSGQFHIQMIMCTNHDWGCLPSFKIYVVYLSPSSKLRA